MVVSEEIRESLHTLLKVQIERIRALERDHIQHNSFESLRRLTYGKGMLSGKFEVAQQVLGVLGIESELFKEIHHYIKL